MNRSICLTAVLALAATTATPAASQPPASSVGQEAQATPRPALRKTPLGRHPSEVLGMKVVVSDMAKSHEFYTKVVGLSPAMSISQREPLPPPGPDRSKWPNEYGYNFSGTFGDAFFVTLPPRKGNVPTRASADLVVLIFKVPDAPAVLRRAREMGYEVLVEAPVAGPGEMSVGFIRDPDGYRVELIQAASYPASP